MAQCTVRRQRRSGPGGQHRNKVETGIFIEHLASGLRAEATEERSQPKNQTIALQRLRLKLAVEYRLSLADDSEECAAGGKSGIAEVGSADVGDSEIGGGRATVVGSPSPLWQSRCRGGRIVVSTSHADFASLLAEAMEQLYAHHDEPRAAAERLGCSASQLIKLVQKHPAAIQRLNSRRIERGLHPLK